MTKIKSYVIFLYFMFKAFFYLSSQDINKAYEYYQTGNYKKAVNEFEIAIPVYEGKLSALDTAVFSKVLYFAALSYAGNGQNAEAETHFNKTREIYRKIGATDCPMYQSVIYSLAEYYYHLNNYDSAIPLYHEMKEIRLKLLGEKHPDYIQSLNDLAFVYKQAGKYEVAEPLFIAGMSLRKEVLGEDHNDYVRSLTNLAKLYEAQKNLKAAELYYKQVRDNRRRYMGEKHTSYAISTNNLAAFYYLNGNYAAAEPLYLEYMIIEKEKLGEKNVEYIESVNNVALVYMGLGKLKEAEIYFIEILRMYHDLLGEKNEHSATALNNLALLYMNMGKYSEAEIVYMKSKKIRKEVLGSQHPDYAQTLNNLAVLYLETGDFHASEKLYNEALKIRKEILGTKNIQYANTLNNLAELYRKMGVYSKAEPLYQEALKIYKENIGIKHPDYATFLNNIAYLYIEIGNFPAAEALFKEVLTIQKEVLGDNHASYANTLNNLADLYSNVRNYSEADSHYKKALKIFKEVLGEKHPSYATSLINLGVLFSNQGKLVEAEQLYKEARNIDKEVHGEKHPTYATTLNNLADLYSQTQRKEDGIKLLLEAKSIYKEVFGENHPDYIISLCNLANNFFSLNQHEKATPYYIEYIKRINQSIENNFSFLSEKEQEMYLKKQHNQFENFYSFALRRKSGDNEITKTVFNNVLRNKGLLLKSSTAVRTAILNSKDTILITFYKKWIDLKKEINKLNTTEISQREKNPEVLEKVANEMEKELVKKSLVFGDYKKLRHATWENVRNRLKSGEAAIEFIHFSQTYCALILKKDSKYPEMIELCREKDLALLLKKISDNDYDNVSRTYGSIEEVNTKLYELIWQPMEKMLEGVTQIFYSPDGLLHRVSFAAIFNNKSVFLCDVYSMKQLSSLSNITDEQTLSITKETTVGLIGGVEYSTDTTTMALWDYLPGTKSETDKLFHLLKERNVKTIYKTGIAAKETDFKTLAADCDMIHISTHGFFFPEELSENNYLTDTIENEQLEATRSFWGSIRGFGVMSFVKNKNPLMRSGLAFAYANDVWSKKYPDNDDDGILTASEVSQMNLSKAKLVVLSACETGLGDIKGSEGVYGLQRAFKGAGVKYIMMTLWTIPDEQTVELMTLFYEKVTSGISVRNAFSETQNEMKKRYPPYYWAGFVLIE